MSLDITILNVDGFPHHVLPVEIDLHHLFMEGFKTRPNSILKRMEDYYEDALFNVNELDEVDAELDWLIAQHAGELKLREFLSAFKDIVALAQKKKVPLEVLAD